MSQEIIRLLRNSTLSTVKIASTAIIFYFISHAMGPETAGLYALARRYVLILGVIVLWGIDILMINEISAAPKMIGRYLVNFTAVRFVLGIAIYLLLFAALWGFSDYPASSRLFILVFSISIIPEGIINLLNAVFISQGEFLLPALAAGILSILKIASSLWIIEKDLPLIYLALALSIASFAHAAVLAPFIYRKTLRLPETRRIWQVIRIHWDRSFIVRETKRSTSFAGIRIFYTLQQQMDLIILSFFVQETTIGIFAAASTIATLFAFFLSGYQEAIYPLMSRLYKTDSHQFWDLFHQNYRIIGILLLPLTFCLSHFAEMIITGLFSEAFWQAAAITRWLLWAVWVQLFDVPNFLVLVVSGNQRSLNRSLLLGTVVNIALNFLWVPSLGVRGAAYIKVITAIFIAAIDYFLVARLVGKPKLFPSIVKYAFASAAMVGIFWVFKAAAFYLAVPAGLFGFYTTLGLCGELSIGEIKSILQALRNRSTG